MGKVVRFPKQNRRSQPWESDDTFESKREETLKQALKQASIEASKLRLIIAQKKLKQARKDLRDAFWRMVMFVAVAILVMKIL
jgi:hypothetical protein